MFFYASFSSKEFSTIHGIFQLVTLFGWWKKTSWFFISVMWERINRNKPKADLLSRITSLSTSWRITFLSMQHQQLIKLYICIFNDNNTHDIEAGFMYRISISAHSVARRWWSKSSRVTCGWRRPFPFGISHRVNRCRTCRGSSSLPLTQLHMPFELDEPDRSSH